MTHEEYKQWETTRKEFLTEFDWIKKLDDGRVMMSIRNGDHPFEVGDWFGGQHVLEFHAYGKSLDQCGEGMTGTVVLSGMPCLMIEETAPYMVEFIKQRREQRPASYNGGGAAS